MSKLHLRIKELRKERSMSTKDLAHIFNVTERTVQRWETGERIPPVDTIIEIAKFFEVTTDYLLGLEN